MGQPDKKHDAWHVSNKNFPVGFPLNKINNFRNKPEN